MHQANDSDLALIPRVFDLAEVQSPPVNGLEFGQKRLPILTLALTDAVAPALGPVLRGALLTTGATGVFAWSLLELAMHASDDGEGFLDPSVFHG